MLAEILMLIGIKARATPFGADPALAAGVPNIEWLAGRLFTGFLLPFEVAALILTVAVIAAVTLTLRKREGTKHQVPSAQARVRAGDRFRMVKMDASRPAPDAPTPADDAGGEGKGWNCSRLGFSSAPTWRTAPGCFSSASRASSSTPRT